MDSAKTARVTGRGLLAGIPLWVRVSAIIAVVLVGILVGSTLLGGTPVAGHGRGGPTGEMEHGAGHTGSATPVDHGGPARAH